MQYVHVHCLKREIHHRNNHFVDLTTAVQVGLQLLMFNHDNSVWTKILVLHLKLMMMLLTFTC